MLSRFVGMRNLLMVSFLKQPLLPAHVRNRDVIAKSLQSIPKSIKFPVGTPRRLNALRLVFKDHAHKALQFIADYREVLLDA